MRSWRWVAKWLAVVGLEQSSSFSVLSINFSITGMGIKKNLLI